MASKKFKQVLFIRFLANMAVLTVILGLIGEFGPVISAEFNYRKDQFFNVTRSVALTTSNNSTKQSATVSNNPNAGFGNILERAREDKTITPISTDYGIVIEKINANSKVISDVDPGNEAQYSKALAQGVAAVKGSNEPGQKGNIYIFSHSVDAPWNIIRFNAVFYLLRELSSGDKVLLFYKGRRFDYVVYDKQIVSPRDLSFLNNRYDQPVLTLQTCDPPGTLLNRLIIRARLEGY